MIEFERRERELIKRQKRERAEELPVSAKSEMNFRTGQGHKGRPLKAASLVRQRAARLVHNRSSVVHCVLTQVVLK